MSAGLFGLLDDVAALARLAAASVDDIGAAAGRASVKAAGVVVDDTAVTPQYVHGVTADREVPIIRRIATGSLRNKLLVILPGGAAAQPVPAVGDHPDPHARRDVPLLRGRAEGLGRLAEAAATDAGARGRRRHGRPRRAAQPEEDEVVKGAIRTDFILSAEIMVIALNEVSDQPFVSRAADPRGRRDRHHPAGVRRGGADREDGRRRAAPGRALVGARRSGSASAWCAGCRGCCGSSPWSASPRCSGSAGTSCWSGSTTSAGTRRTTSVHHVEEAVHDAVVGHRRRAGWIVNTAGLGRGRAAGRRRRGRGRCTWCTGQGQARQPAGVTEPPRGPVATGKVVWARYAREIPTKRRCAAHPPLSHQRNPSWTSRLPTCPWPTTAAPRSPSPSTRCPA